MKTNPFRFILLLGAVSLFADFTYEGARSITGPFLGSLGASAFWISFIAGAGELAGYGLRIFFGYLSDRTRRYWLATALGYVINLLAVPALALAGRWEIAAGLVIMERLGKAIRTPARDVLLSHATKQVGRGWGFGIHEALDQIGAVLGPLAIGFILYLNGDYRFSLALLIIPALAALTILFLSMHLYPAPQKMEEVPKEGAEKLPITFWLYIIAAGLSAFGYIDYPLIAFHLERHYIFTKEMIPILYAVVMAVDAISALLCGYLYDRLGLRTLTVVVFVAAFFAPLVFLIDNSLFVWVGALLWGIGLGAQESIMRAAVADLIPYGKRGTGYGIFQTGYGLCWFIGSALFGYLYQVSIFSMALVSSFSLFGSSLLFLFLNRSKKLKPSSKSLT